MSNELQFEIPSWMNIDYFENVLKEITKDARTLLHSIEFGPASRAGDGFASTIFRVNCVYDAPHHENKFNEKISLIVKTEPIEEGLKKIMLNHERAFRTEIKMYSEVLPKIELALTKALQKPIKIGPSLLFQSLTPAPVIILEDLIELGCEMSETTFGYDESLLVVTRLAQLHAASVYVNQNQIDLSQIRNSFFHIDKTKDFCIADRLISQSLKLFIEAAEKRDDYSPVVIERLKYFCDHFIELLEEVYVSTENKKYFVLTHNDYHRKNMVFKKKNDKIVDFYLFDYQFCLWSTPVIDLFYFFYQICSKETRQKYRPDLIRSYFEEYQKILKALNCNTSIVIPCLEELDNEFLKFKAAEVMQVVCFYKYQFMSWTDEDLKKLGKLDHFTQTKAIYAGNLFHAAVKPELERLLLNEGF
uniref:CSON015135 protein n=1 Tax=Culicoides sonorensis TaxID=179676 RepID=A0A336KTF4_CULSO